MSIMRLLLPDKFTQRVSDIDFRELYVTGIRVLLIDIDNTLIRHGGDALDDYAYGIITNAEEAGMKCLLFSNAKSSRLKKISGSSGIDHMIRPMKPSGKGIRYYLREHNESSANNLAVIGDQIFTDVLSGNLAGTMTVLVEPLDNDEPFQIKFKRWLEKSIKNRIAIDKITPLE